MSSSIAKPQSQFNTPAKSESQCQEEIRKQGFVSKRDAKKLIAFPLDCRLKGKMRVKVFKCFPE